MRTLAVLLMFMSVSAQSAVTNRFGALTRADFVATAEGYRDVKTGLESARRDFDLRLTAHGTNHSIHITAEERSTWNSKQAPLRPGTDYATPAQLDAVVGAVDETVLQMQTSLTNIRTRAAVWDAKQDAITPGVDYAVPGAWTGDVRRVEALTESNKALIAAIEASTNSWNSKQDALVPDVDYATAGRVTEVETEAAAMRTALAERISSLESSTNSWNSKQSSLDAGIDYVTPQMVAGDLQTVGSRIDETVVRIGSIESMTNRWDAKQDPLSPGVDYATPSNVTEMVGGVETVVADKRDYADLLYNVPVSTCDYWYDITALTNAIRFVATTKDLAGTHRPVLSRFVANFEGVGTGWQSLPDTVYFLKFTRDDSTGGAIFTAVFLPERRELGSKSFANGADLSDPLDFGDVVFHLYSSWDEIAVKSASDQALADAVRSSESYTDSAVAGAVSTLTGHADAGDAGLSARLSLIEANTNTWSGKQEALTPGVDFITPSSLANNVNPIIDSKIAEIQIPESMSTNDVRNIVTGEISTYTDWVLAVPAKLSDEGLAAWRSAIYGDSEYPSTNEVAVAKSDETEHGTALYKIVIGGYGATDGIAPSADGLRLEYNGAGWEGMGTYLGLGEGDLIATRDVVVRNSLGLARLEDLEGLGGAGADSETVSNLVNTVGRLTDTAWVRPDDWRVIADVVSSPTELIDVNVTTNYAMVHSNQLATYSYSLSANLRVELLDEFAMNDALPRPAWAVPDGCTMDGSLFTAPAPGTWRVTASHGSDVKYCDVPLTFRTGSQVSRVTYVEDIADSNNWRKAVNDEVLSVLRNATWNGVTNVIKRGSDGWGNNDDYPYKRWETIRCPCRPVSGSALVGYRNRSALTPHVLIAAAHYGYNGCAGSGTWVTPDGTVTSVVSYVGLNPNDLNGPANWGVRLSKWAVANGWTEEEVSKLNINDIAVFPVTSGEIPEECCPYVMSVEAWRKHFGGGRAMGWTSSRAMPSNWMVPCLFNLRNLEDESTVYCASGWSTASMIETWTSTAVNWRDTMIPSAAETYLKSVDWMFPPIYMGDSGGGIYLKHEDKWIMCSEFHFVGGGGSVSAALPILRAYCAQFGDVLKEINE